MIQSGMRRRLNSGVGTLGLGMTRNPCEVHVVQVVILSERIEPWVCCKWNASLLTGNQE